MEKILTDEMTQAIHAVGKMIRDDARYAEMTEASAAYTNSGDVNSMLDEYTALQTSLAGEYEKTDYDETAVKKIQDRMNELYSLITNHPAYVRFKEASAVYSELTDALYAELEFAVTGERRAECTHDCSTCHGCD